LHKKYTILVCRGPTCGDRRFSADVHDAFARELGRAQLNGNEAVLDRYSCFGKCERGVNVLIRENRPGENPIMARLMPTQGGGAIIYHRVEPKEAGRILEEHVGNGRTLVEFTQRK
jgi:(2Fe-2S) ferredoxin